MSLSTTHGGLGVVVPKTHEGWMYRRNGDYLESIQRFITRLRDSGGCLYMWLLFGIKFEISETFVVNALLNIITFRILSYLFYQIQLLVSKLGNKLHSIFNSLVNINLDKTLSVFLDIFFTRYNLISNLRFLSCRLKTRKQITLSS